MTRSIPLGCVARRLNSLLFALFAPCQAGASTQIHQVLMNLCTNAGHAMQDIGGTLEIRFENTALDSGFAARYPGLKPGK